MRFHLLAVAGVWLLLGCAPGVPDDPASAPGTSRAAAAPGGHDSQIGPDRGLPHASVIASLPDRGELLAHDRSRKVIRAGAATFYPVIVSERHALNATGSQQLMFNSPTGEAIRLMHLRHVQHPGDRWTWVGRAVDGAIATLTFGVRDVCGVIPRSGQSPLRVGSSPAGVWLATASDDTAVQDGRSPFPIAAFADPAAFMDVPVTSGASATSTSPLESMKSGQATTATPASLRMARHDLNRDGKADIFWTRNPALAQHQSIWFMNGPVLIGGRYLPQPFDNGNQCCSSTILGAGDLDGDGAADFFRTEHDDRFRMTLVTVPGPNYDRLEEHGFVPGYPHRYPHGWLMAGLHDMDGDARTDIAWTPDRRDFYSCGTFPGEPAWDQLSRWFMAGEVLLGGRLDNLGDCTMDRSVVVTPGDFNGDGRGDFIYRRGLPAQGGTARVLLTAQDGSPVPSGADLALPVGWTVVGSGNFNSDSKADVVLRHAQSGEIMVWFMDGGVVTGSKNEAQSSGWKVVAIADFDGNGYDDLLWTNIEPDANSDNGYLLMWRMRTDGQFEGSYVGSYPNGWHVINSTY